jgi:hypothetical protein
LINGIHFGSNNPNIYIFDACNLENFTESKTDSLLSNSKTIFLTANFCLFIDTCATVCELIASELDFKCQSTFTD